MDRRLQLQEALEEILGSKNVYFQPPPNIKLRYPCIIYNRSMEDVKFADDRPYKRKKRYKVTVIDANPDSHIPDEVASLPLCNFDRHYTSDNLNHDVYNLYF